MTVTRRSFLVGAGAVLTAAFVKEAEEFARDSQRPLLPPAIDANKELFYEQVEDYWRLHLGVPQFEIPEPQLLIENLRWHGNELGTQAQIDAFCADTGWSEAQLFAPMNDWDWETQWEHNLNPEAKAFVFLSENKLFPPRGGGRREGALSFEEFSNPMSNWRWVEVHDPLSLSLLQARLNELKLATKVSPYTPGG